MQILVNMLESFNFLLQARHIKKLIHRNNLKIGRRHTNVRLLLIHETVWLHWAHISVTMAGAK